MGVRTTDGLDGIFDAGALERTQVHGSSSNDGCGNEGTDECAQKQHPFARYTAQCKSDETQFNRPSSPRSNRGEFSFRPFAALWHDDRGVIFAAFTERPNHDSNVVRRATASRMRDA